MRALAAAAALLMASALASNARAAGPLRVLSALEDDDPLPDVWLGVGYEHQRRTAKINREWVQRDGDGNPLSAQDVRELDFTEYFHTLNIDARVGLFRDLELHVRAPIILAYRSRVGFQDGVESTSTIWGTTNANDPTFDYRYPLTEVPGERQRAGLGDMTFGVSWSPFVDTKDEAYPTLTLTADIIAPTGGRWDPADQAALLSTDGSGSVGRGQTVFDLSVGLSKQMRQSTPYLDPYVLFGARLPIATSAQKEAGMQPPISGRVQVGSVVVIHERAKTKERYALDLGFRFRYVALGRTYSPLSDYLPNLDQTKVLANRLPENMDLPLDAVTYDDYANAANYAQTVSGARCGMVDGVPCGELNRVDEHLELQGVLGLELSPSEWFTFKTGVQVGFVTGHLITAESVGTDTDPASASNLSCPAGSGAPCVGRVNARNSQGEDERSPYYDPRYDQPGRRLRAEQIFTLTAYATLALTF